MEEKDQLGQERGGRMSVTEDCGSEDADLQAFVGQTAGLEDESALSHEAERRDNTEWSGTE